MATHSSILAWRILWTEEPGGLLSIGSHRVGHNWSDLACVHASILFKGFPNGASGKESTCQWRRHQRLGFDPWIRKIPWSRKRQPTLVFLPGKFHGLRNLVSYSPWGHKELDTTEWLNISRSPIVLKHLIFQKYIYIFPLSLNIWRIQISENCYSREKF